MVLGFLALIAFWMICNSMYSWQQYRFEVKVIFFLILLEILPVYKIHVVKLRFASSHSFGTIG